MVHVAKKKNLVMTYTKNFYTMTKITMTSINLI